MEVRIEGRFPTGDELVELAKQKITDSLEEWTQTINITAQTNCGNPNVRLVFTENATKGGRYDRKALDCLIKAINQHLPTMPDWVSGFFTEVLTRLESAKVEALKTEGTQSEDESKRQSPSP